MQREPKSGEVWVRDWNDFPYMVRIHKINYNIDFPSSAKQVFYRFYYGLSPTNVYEESMSSFCKSFSRVTVEQLLL